MKLRRPVWKLIYISAVILGLLCVSGCIESGQPAKKTVSQKESQQSLRGRAHFVSAAKLTAMSLL